MYWILALEKGSFIYYKLIFGQFGAFFFSLFNIHKYMYIFYGFNTETLYQQTGPLISWPTFPWRSMVLVYR